MGGKQSLPRITPQDKAILDLKLQRDNLKQYQKRVQILLHKFGINLLNNVSQIQGVLDREHVIAKAQLAAGQQDRALIALRRRKYQHSLLTKTEEQLETLEHLVSTIEFSLVEVSVLRGLKQGNDVLKEIHKQMNVESVEKLLEETAEAREYQREMSEMLANNLTLDDEEAVQTELRAMQKDIMKETLPIELPAAPRTQPRTSVEQGALSSRLSLTMRADAISDKVAIPA